MENNKRNKQSVNFQELIVGEATSVAFIKTSSAWLET
jgi:hypothetical protein